MEVIYEPSKEWNEKHIPVIEKDEIWYKIYVWEVLHPMSQQHSIERIKVILKDWSELKFDLDYHQLPIIYLPGNLEISEVQAFCNLHWLRGKKL